MKVRLLTGLGIAAVGLPLLYFWSYPTFAAALALFAFIATYEMLRVLGTEKNYLISVPSYIMALALPLGTYFACPENSAVNVKRYLLGVAAVFFGFLIYMFFLAVLLRGGRSAVTAAEADGSKRKNPFVMDFSKISEVFTSLTYIICSFTALGVLPYINNGGIWNLSLVFLAAWGTDVFAFFVGTFFGKHKLIPEISPKKTVEGAVGAVIIDIGAFILFGFIVGRAAPHFVSSYTVTPNYLVLALCGLILSVVSQLGDLVASLIKREHGIKDYGNLLPGHGGMLDRFDSVLSVTTVLMIICMFAPPFTVV